MNNAPAGASPPAPSLGGLLLVSLLFMLNVTAIFTVTTGMDLYGFYTLEPVAAFPLPLALSTLLNVSMAGAGYACYRWLWRRQAWFTGGRWGPFTRGAMLSGVPVFLGYAPAILLTSYGGIPSVIAVAGLMAGSLCITHALRDSEANLDPVIAKYWFAAAISVILVFLACSVGAMLVMYAVEQMPASGSLLWQYEYEWSNLGYPREEFHHRQRDAVAGFTLIGSGFMIVVLGGSLLGAILKWTSPRQGVETDDASPDAAWSSHSGGEGNPARRSLSARPDTEEPGFTLFLNGREFHITPRQYGRLMVDKDGPLREATLLVDKEAGSVYAREGENWTRIRFGGRRKGPFLLLCVLARHPGIRFANGQLEVLLRMELPERDTLNISDLFAQLHSRYPLVPIKRDDAGIYLSDSVNVCFLNVRQTPANSESETPSTSP